MIDITLTPETTDLEILRAVVRALTLQGGRSMDGRGECRYRAPNGWACALGQLIADRHYRPSAEGVLLSAVECRAVGDPRGDVTETRWVASGAYAARAEHLAICLNASGVPARHSTRGMLRRLQEIHDGVMGVDLPWPVVLARMTELEVGMFDGDGMWRQYKA
jgi:hypothetical protein